MEKVTEHHLIWERKQIQRIGGSALWLRGIRPMRVPLIASVHNDLHANIDAVSFLPQEHARRAFSGVYDIGLEHLSTIDAVDSLAVHFGRISLSKARSEATRRIAGNLEENLQAQRQYLIDGMV